MNGLRNLLWLGVVYDLAAGVLLLWMPDWLLAAFRHPVPADPFLFRLSALPLLLFPLVYGAAAIDPAGRPHLVRVSFRLRLFGGLAIAAVVLWQKPTAPLAYWCFAIGDLVWAALIVVVAALAGLRTYGD